MNDRNDVEFVFEEGKRAELPRRFFTMQQMMAGVFLGGPLAGFFMMRRNFLTMGEEDKASVMGFWGIISMFPFLFAALLIPPEVPGVVLQGIVLVFFAAYAHKAQHEALVAMEKSGTMQRFTHWRVAGTAFMAAFITLAIGVALIYAIEAFSPELYQRIFPEVAELMQENAPVQVP